MGVVLSMILENWKILLGCGVLVVALGVGLYQHGRIQTMKAEVATLTRDLEASKAQVAALEVKSRVDESAIGALQDQAEQVQRNCSEFASTVTIVREIPKKVVPNGKTKTLDRAVLGAYVDVLNDHVFCELRSEGQRTCGDR